MKSGGDRSERGSGIEEIVRPAGGSLGATGGGGVTLDLKTVALLASGMQYGYSFEVIVGHPTCIVRARKGSRGFIFQFWPGFLSLARRKDFHRLPDKVLQRELLQDAGLPAPRLYQVVSGPEGVDRESVRFPAVVKPRHGRGSEDVFTGLKNHLALAEAVAMACREGQDVVIEEHIEGDHYRLLVVDGEMVSCAERRPASVAGDGVHRIADLVRMKNKEPGRPGARDIFSLTHRLVIDQTARRLLASQGFALGTVPAKGQLVRLQEKVLGSLGADFVDVTDRVNAATTEGCQSFAVTHDLFLVGFDFISPDVSKSCEEVGAFNEFNVRNVHFGVGEFCNVGARRPISNFIWDHVPFDEVSAPWFPIF